MAAPRYPEIIRFHPPRWLGLCGGLLLSLVLFTGCGTGHQAQRFEANPGMRQRGLASYYANKLAGRPTASGEPYRPAQLTAAHRMLPLGTTLRVVRLDRGGRPTGHEVTVRVNDRGPYTNRLIVDLSYAAAQRLGMIGAGVIPVELEVLSVPARKRRR